MQRILFLIIVAITLTACVSHIPIDSTSVTSVSSQAATLESTPTFITPVWTAPSNTATQIPPTPEVKQLPLCLEATKFKDCYIPPEAILDKSFTEYLKTLNWPTFNEAKLVFRKLVRFNWNNNYDEIRYSEVTAPNYPKEETRPYQRLAFGWTMDQGNEYFVSAVRYYVKDVNPKNYPWVVALIRVPVDETGKITTTLEQSIVNPYINKMNFPVYLATDSLIVPPGIQFPDHLFGEIFTQYPDIQTRIDAFVAGDPTALDGVLLQAESESVFGGNFDK